MSRDLPTVSCRSPNMHSPAPINGPLCPVQSNDQRRLKDEPELALRNLRGTSQPPLCRESAIMH
eukprot:scaffold947_cov375-Prasinococcus_capsulatus_cf.AAC.16